MNFEQLKIDLEEACEKCFTALRAKYTNEMICGYALYSDAGAMSISPALNSKRHLEEVCSDDPGDAIYYKWSPGEWAYEFDGAEFFEEISISLREEINKLDGQNQFSEFRANVYEACVASLEGLLNRGFFAQDSEDNIIVFTISDADEPENEIKWIKRLNGKKQSSEFAGWVRSL